MLHDDNWARNSSVEDLLAEKIEDFHLASSLLEEIYQHVLDVTEWTYRLARKTSKPILM